MSVDYSTHVGVYVKCFNPPLDKWININACNNKECKNYAKYNYGGKPFCSECGGKIMDMQVIKTEPKHFDCRTQLGNENLYELIRETKPENLKNYSFYAPNQSGYAVNIDNKYDTTEIELTLDKMHNEIMKFEKDHREELSKLRQFFGEVNVEIKYGVVCYSW